MANRTHTQHQKHAVPGYSRNHPGAGLVTAAGGRYVAFAWANMALHRILGSQLPMEVWYLPGELTLAGLQLMEVIGAQPRQLQAKTSKYWTLPFAVHESGFEEVILIAADFMPFVPLDSLLDNDAYLHSGALFAADYPDVREEPFYPSAYHRVGLRRPRCKGGGPRCPEVTVTDSALLVLNKRGCPGASEALKDLAVDGEESGRYGTRGDTEIWSMAWQLAGCAHGFTQFPGLPGTPYTDGKFAGPLAGWVHFLNSGEPLGVHWGDMGKQELIESGRLVAFAGFAHAPPGGYYTKGYFNDSSGFLREQPKCYGPDSSTTKCMYKPLGAKSKTTLIYLRALYRLADELFYHCPNPPPPRTHTPNATKYHRGCPLRQAPDARDVHQQLARIARDMRASVSS